MKPIYWLLAISLLTASSAFAEGRSKRLVLVEKDWSEPAVKTNPLRAKGVLLGARFGQGGAFEGSLALGANFEYMYNEEFGFGAQGYHAAYSTEIAAGPLKAEMSTKAITIVGLGNYHPAFIKAKNFDPYISVGLAHSFVKTTGTIQGDPEMQARGPMPGLEVKGDRSFMVGSLNARYFLDKNLSAVGSLSLGLSTLTLGMDYLF